MTTGTEPTTNFPVSQASVAETAAPLPSLLALLRRELSVVLKNQLDQVILFGSQARGEAVAGSDVDVLIVVKEEPDYGDLIQRTSDLVGRLSLQYDIVISRAFVSCKRYAHEESPFLINVRREGVPV